MKKMILMALLTVLAVQSQAAGTKVGGEREGVRTEDRTKDETRGGKSRSAMRAETRAGNAVIRVDALIRVLEVEVSNNLRADLTEYTLTTEGKVAIAAVKKAAGNKVEQQFLISEMVLAASKQSADAQPLNIATTKANIDALKVYEEASVGRGENTPETLQKFTQLNLKAAELMKSESLSKADALAKALSEIEGISIEQAAERIKKACKKA